MTASDGPTRNVFANHRQSTCRIDPSTPEQQVNSQRRLIFGPRPSIYRLTGGAQGNTGTRKE